MTATLESLRNRVENILADATNAIWTTAALDEAIQRALEQYAKPRPFEKIGTVSIFTAGYEVDVSSLSGILNVSRIWCDYTASNPEDPPNQRAFEYWPDSQIVRVVGYEPQSGNVMRVFYTTQQTLNGLSGATETTFPADDEGLIALGGAAYAATTRSVDLTEQVTLDRTTAAQIRAWGLATMQEFTAGLKRVTARHALQRSALVKQPKLDIWEGTWA
jgi:hypothetical protein